MNNRTLELILGLSALMSVISVPVRQSLRPKPLPCVIQPHVNVVQLERLHQDALTQQQELTKLTHDTQTLSEILSHPVAPVNPPTHHRHRGRDFGTVRDTPDGRGSETVVAGYGSSRISQ